MSRDHHKTHRLRDRVAREVIDNPWLRERLRTVDAAQVRQARRVVLSKQSVEEFLAAGGTIKKIH